MAYCGKNIKKTIYIDALDSIEDWFEGVVASFNPPRWLKFTLLEFIVKTDTPSTDSVGSFGKVEFRMDGGSFGEVILEAGETEASTTDFFIAAHTVPDVSIPMTAHEFSTFDIGISQINNSVQNKGLKIIIKLLLET